MLGHVAAEAAEWLSSAIQLNGIIPLHIKHTFIIILISFLLVTQASRSVIIRNIQHQEFSEYCFDNHLMYHPDLSLNLCYVTTYTLITSICNHNMNNCSLSSLSARDSLRDGSKFLMPWLWLVSIHSDIHWRAYLFLPFQVESKKQCERKFADYSFNMNV